MKKFAMFLFTLFIVTVLSQCTLSPAFAGTKSLTFQWEKPVIEADLSKFELQYTVDDPTVEDPNTIDEERVWEHLVDVPYVAGQTSPFTDEAVLTSPDGQELWYWFRIRAEDASTNVSSWNYGSTDEPNCKAWIDFKDPEGTIEFTVTVEVVSTQ